LERSHTGGKLAEGFDFSFPMPQAAYKQRPSHTAWFFEPSLAFPLLVGNDLLF
jgi:hypothetical protein